MKSSKLLTLLLSNVLFVFITRAQTTSHKTDIEESNLKGSVKSVTVLEYPDNGTVNKGIKEYAYQQQRKTVSRSISNYNKAGNGTEFYYFNYKDSLTEKSFMKYDDKGNVTESIGYDAKGNIIYQDSYKYDDKGNVMEATHSYMYPGYSSSGSSTYTYDGDGNATVTTYTANGEIKETGTEKYDKRGDLLEYVRYSPDKKLTEKTINTYDAKYNRLESTDYNGNDSVTHKVTCRYNENEDEVLNDNIQNDGTKTHTEEVYKEYDTKGNWIKRAFYHRLTYRANEGQERTTEDYTIQERVIEYY